MRKYHIVGTKGPTNEPWSGNITTQKNGQTAFRKAKRLFRDLNVDSLRATRLE